MKLAVMAMFDSAAEAFGRPIFCPAVGAGVRSLADEVNRSAPDNPMFNHPQDFSLFDLGVFDDSVGLFTLHERPKLVCQASALKVIPVAPAAQANLDLQ